MMRRSSRINADLRRPVGRAALERSQELAPHYRILVDQEEIGFFGSVVEMRGVMGDEATANACVAATRAALVTAIAHLLENGDEPPLPAIDAAD